MSFRYISLCLVLSFFFFIDTATTEIYTLSLHDALPISNYNPARSSLARSGHLALTRGVVVGDRKSTRLNSSHSSTSYAVFSLKKKNPKHNVVPCRTKHTTFTEKIYNESNR